MRDRVARGLSWSVVVVYYLLGVAGIVLQGLAGETWSGHPLPALLIVTIAIGLWPVLGAVIVTRHPGNRIGWILSLTLLPWAVECFAAGYAAYSAVGLPRPLPGESLARLWMAAGGIGLPIFGFFLLILLFPNGKPVSPSLRAVIWIGLAAMAVAIPVLPFNPKPLDIAGLSSPLRVSASEWDRFRPLVGISMAALVAAVAAAAVSLIYRFRGSRGRERQQLKWFTYAMVFFPLQVSLAAYLTLREATAADLIAQLAWVAANLTAVGVGAATATAILRHRLYEIDIIIKRTLVYGLLTSGLILIYFASVVAIRATIGEFTGQESPIAIVASTLVVATLFQPLRRRVQVFIDRRFYRHKYDAEAALAAFASTLRDEVDFEALTANLLNVVEDTMHPEHVSLWIRPRAGTVSDSPEKMDRQAGASEPAT